MAIRHAATLLLGLATLFCAPPAAARDPTTFSISAGSLARALELYAQQAGIELIYRSDEIVGARSPGVAGRMSGQAGLRALLAGSGFTARRDPSGAYAVVRETKAARRPERGLRPAEPRRLADEVGGSGSGEITVTARKRQESIMKVPVVETVITGEMLEQAAINDIARLTTRVPGLLLGNGVLAIGPQISLRGIGTSTQDAGVDQSVSLNLDGLSVAQGLAYRAGLFDVAQVEVLKGPQALFYGKSSTGGVLALRTNDPGDRLEIIGRTFYELEAREKRGSLILSAPVSETLGVRFAGLYSDMEGFFRNKATALPGTGAMNPRHSRYDDGRAFILRATLKWNPSPAFEARLKVNVTGEKVEGNSTHNQLRSCPDGVGAVPGTGIPFLNPNDDCKLDRTSWWVDMDPAAFAGIRNDGIPFISIRQRFGTLELNHEVAPALTLTSVTGYYRLKTDTFINSAQSGFSAPPFATDNRFRRRDVTQEIRLDSDYAGPVNFTLGAYAQDADILMLVSRSINRQLPIVIPVLQTRGTHDLDVKTISLFGQLRWKAAPELEIAGGVRYADEKRGERHVNLLTNSVVPLAVDRVRAKNWSPEITLTYTPTDDLTLFASLKQAYKSGGFTLTQVLSAGANNSFGDEKVRGGEIGLKARLLDRTLRLNLAAYRYEYEGLQVGTTETSPITDLPLARTLNAGAARVYGVDFDVAWRPPAIAGFVFNAAVNWTHARFVDLHGVPCWGGQTIAEGCNEFRNPATGRFTAQGLDGLRLVRAPDWQLQAGADYTMAAGEELSVNLGASGQYTSRYPTALSRRRDVVHPDVVTINAHAALRGPGEAWEVAVIGNNLGNRIGYASCTQANFANGAVLSGIITGGTVRGPAGIDEVMCAARRGREIWLRLTVRPVLLLD